MKLDYGQTTGTGADDRIIKTKNDRGGSPTGTVDSDGTFTNGMN